MSRQWTFNFEVVTPMFIGGASPNGEAEIRPPSIKGLLRWWFRALGGSKEWEARLFGATGRESSKSRMRLKVTPGLRFNVKEVKAERFNGELGYLGYGPIGWDREARGMVNQRPFIDPESIFSLQIDIINTEETDYYALLLSIWALANLGGIGSRSRRGWGSVRIIEASEEEYLQWNFDSSEEFYRYLPEFFNKVKKVFGTFPEFSEYTAFSLKSQIVIGEELVDWKKALSGIGRKIIDFRERKYYHDIKRLMEKAGRNPNGLPSSWNATAGKEDNTQYDSPVPKAIFGLPNNYMSRTRRGDKDRSPQYPWQISVNAVQIYGSKSEEIDRRASPLLIKISQWENGKYSWIVTYLPSKFLPDGAMLRLGFPEKGLPPKKVKNPELHSLYITLKKKILTANPPTYDLLDEFASSLKDKGRFVLYLTEVLL